MKKYMWEGIGVDGTPLLTDESPIKVLQVSPRTERILKQYEFDTVGELAATPPGVCNKLHGFGPATINEVRQQLRRRRQQQAKPASG